jgi:hypothetical protein
MSYEADFELKIKLKIRMIITIRDTKECLGKMNGMY